MADMEPQVFTADYVGTPGKRTFYLQARAGDEVHSFLLEKDQVDLLAEKFRELLLLIDARDPISGAQPERDPGLGLADVADAEMRIGSMGLSYDDDADRLILFVTSVDTEAEDPEALAEEGIRLTLRRDQVRAFVLHAIAIVREGRPICQLCGLPMDPEGHKCPASNGHRLTV
jgi:uncharacterized repeat protein (TIGR03847 family)